MADHEVAWPVGTSDRDPALSSRPMVFSPKGFLVAILADEAAARRAASELRAAGIADRRLRIFTSSEILEDHERYTAQQGLPRRVVAALTDDQEIVDVYLRHARDGRCALWVHVPDDDEASRAVRKLSDCATLHIRHYGRRGSSDFYLERPTSTLAARREGRS